VSDTEESAILIRRAKEGDREAWKVLCEKYYPRWLERFHNKLGDDLRGTHDTQDLVQSAIVDALRDIQSLRCETAFFSWVSAIIHRKIAKVRRNCRAKLVPLEGLHDEDGEPKARCDGYNEGDYLRLLDALLALFPDYPDNMAAVYLHYFVQLDRDAQAEAFGRSVRTVHRLTDHGVALLRARLG
jgi:DNA-directed RNA polymerase specialized sigma24 family protein